jgi:hypothetical protein
MILAYYVIDFTYKYIAAVFVSRVVIPYGKKFIYEKVYGLRYDRLLMYK